MDRTYFVGRGISGACFETFCETIVGTPVDYKEQKALKREKMQKQQGELVMDNKSLPWSTPSPPPPIHLLYHSLVLIPLLPASPSLVAASLEQRDSKVVVVLFVPRQAGVVWYQIASWLWEQEIYMS